MTYFRFKPEVIVLKRLFAILIGNLLLKPKSLLIEELSEMLNADLFSQNVNMFFQELQKKIKMKKISKNSFPILTQKPKTSKHLITCLSKRSTHTSGLTGNEHYSTNALDLKT